MFRRMGRLGRHEAFLTPLQLRQLNQANAALAQGQPQIAAPLFAELAAEMETPRIGIRHPRRAANFHAQAAHAFAEAGEEGRALLHARAALNLFTQFQMANRIPRFYTNILRHLRNKKLEAGASQLEKEFSGSVNALPQPASPPARRGRLPSSCPQCGAPARSDEVDWIDEHSAECVYCGAVIQAEET